MKPSSWRQRTIRRSAELQKFFREGKRCSSGRFRGIVLRSPLPYCRFAVIVPRRLGHAVHRNRTRRVIREILRTALAEWTGKLDLLVLSRGLVADGEGPVAREELQQLLITVRHRFYKSHDS